MANRTRANTAVAIGRGQTRSACLARIARSTSTIGVGFGAIQHHVVAGRRLANRRGAHPAQAIGRPGTGQKRRTSWANASAAIDINFEPVLHPIFAAAASLAVALVGAAFALRVHAVGIGLARPLRPGQTARLAGTAASRIAAVAIHTKTAGTLVRCVAGLTIGQFDGANTRHRLAIVTRQALAILRAGSTRSAFAVTALAIVELQTPFAHRAIRAFRATTVDVRLCTIEHVVGALERHTHVAFAELLRTAVHIARANHAIALAVAYLAAFKANRVRRRIELNALVRDAASETAGGVLAGTVLRLAARRTGRHRHGPGRTAVAPRAPRPAIPSGSPNARCCRAPTTGGRGEPLTAALQGAASKRGQKGQQANPHTMGTSLAH